LAWDLLARPLSHLVVELPTPHVTEGDVMKYLKSSVVLATTLGVSLIAAFPRSAPPALATPTAFDWMDIPAYLRGNSGAGTVREGNQAGTLELDGIAKVVRIDWKASAVCNEPPDYSLPWNVFEHTLGNHKVIKVSQEISRRYFPTACCALDSSTLLIAGVHSNGKVLIEKVELVWPSPMPSVVIDTATGITSVNPVVPSVGQTTALYESDLQSGGLIRCMSKVNRQGEAMTQALFMLDESNDVFTVDLSSGAVSLLASPTDASASLGLVPLLSGKDQTSISAMDHRVQGYTYAFRRNLGLQPTVSDPSIPSILILVDSDRDGDMDAPLQLSPDDYMAQDWFNLQ